MPPNSTNMSSSMSTSSRSVTFRLEEPQGHYQVHPSSSHHQQPNNGDNNNNNSNSNNNNNHMYPAVRSVQHRPSKPSLKPSSHYFRSLSNQAPVAVTTPSTPSTPSTYSAPLAVPPVPASPIHRQPQHQYQPQHHQQQQSSHQPFTPQAPTTRLPQPQVQQQTPVMSVTPSPTNNSNSNSSSSSAADTSIESDDAWRNHGKLHRSRLVIKDEEKGGNTFVLSDGCSIERYYRVAERVLEQFLSTSIGESQELTESYLVGNRLVKFLSVVLPTHTEYFCPDPQRGVLRQRSQGQLMELLQYMDELSLLIDEMQYNKYILNDLTPEEKTHVSELTASTANDTTLTSLEEEEEEEEESLDKENLTYPNPHHQRDHHQRDQPSLWSEDEMSSIRDDEFQQKVAAVVTSREREDPPSKYHNHVVAAVLARSTPPPGTESPFPRVRSSRRPKSKSKATSSSRGIAWPEEAEFESMSWGASFSEFSDAPIMMMHAPQSRIDLLDQNSSFQPQSQSQLYAPRTRAQQEQQHKRTAPPLSPPPPAAPPPSARSKSRRSKSFFPKLKQPPRVANRTVRAKVANSYSPPTDDASVFDPPPMPAKVSVVDPFSQQATVVRDDTPVKTKIEERWNRAARVQQELDDHDMTRSQRPRLADHQSSRHSLSGNDGENHSLSTMNHAQTNRRLLQHFKGCVRCLID